MGKEEIYKRNVPAYGVMGCCCCCFCTLAIIAGVLPGVLWSGLIKGLEDCLIHTSADPGDSCYDSWVTDTASDDAKTLYDLYYFNITNLDGWLTNGEKPILEEVGPYSYYKYTTYDNPTWFNGDNNVEIFEWVYRVFNPSTSCSTCTQDDVIVTINEAVLGLIFMADPRYYNPNGLDSMLPLLGAILFPWMMGNPQPPGVPSALPCIDTLQPPTGAFCTPLITNADIYSEIVTAEQRMFGFNNTLLSAIFQWSNNIKLITSLFPAAQQQAMGIPSTGLDLAATLAAFNILSPEVARLRNGTTLEWYRTQWNTTSFYTGSGNNEEINYLYSYNGLRTNPMWAEPYSYDGLIFDQAGILNSKIEDEDSVNIYVNEVQRPVSFNFIGDETWKNIKLKRYSIQDFELQNSTTYPFNAKWYQNWGYGLGNLSIYAGSPLFLSYRHFYKSAYEDMNAYWGMQGLPVGNELPWVDFEPITGLMFRGNKPLQQNMPVMSSIYFPQTAVFGADAILMPLIGVHEHGQATDDQADDFYNGVYGLIFTIIVLRITSFWSWIVMACCCCCAGCFSAYLYTLDDDGSINKRGPEGSASGGSLPTDNL